MQTALTPIGWYAELEASFSPYQVQGYTVGRVVLEHKRNYRIHTVYGMLLAEVSGKLRYHAQERQDYPAVGDWVVISARPEEERATIHAILPRKSKFSRKAAGTSTEEQIVAANVDTIFLVNALNHDLNIRRIERYMVMAWESGANPVIVLSKADLCEDIEAALEAVETIAIGVPIHIISAKDNEGMESLTQYLTLGKTGALLGSSGVGKSTIINWLCGKDLQPVSDIREKDDKGRHTTTQRELFPLPIGGVLIDTPGMRELQLWEADENLNQSFRDIEDLSQRCQFNDCGHQKEPRCAVREAINEGRLDKKRYDSYMKLQKELAYFNRKADLRAQSEEKKRWKKLSGDRTRVHRR
ncbi:ribosome small subunit-dependent GTPase A [Ammoniphilus sp. YIM 78166]|uniref:ribosome small subunit-dependent GTPase A n=1 Tax=Ammoniphilus sp. YIM 78166 TaxID=1644106 RepID=UPI0035199A59